MSEIREDLVEPISQREAPFLPREDGVRFAGEDSLVNGDYSLAIYRTRRVSSITFHSQMVRRSRNSESQKCAEWIETVMACSVPAGVAPGLTT